MVQLRDHEEEEDRVGGEMMRFSAQACVAVAMASVVGAIQDVPLYKTPGAPINDRVTDLVSRMTIEEKTNQLVIPFGASFPDDYIKAGFNTSGLGGTYPLKALPGEQWWETRNNWQRNAVENSRLGIPTSFIEETLHSGYDGGTNFPMPCLQGSTWNRELVGQAAAVIALEASSAGVDRGFSPVLHFCTDPRFGRCEESFGEDPTLLATMGVAAVTGLAGEGGPGAASTYIDRPDIHIATEAKHYAAYGFCGRDGGCPAEISDNTLYDVYLKPWYKYAQAGGRAIMAAHNEVNGMPCHAHAELNRALRVTFGMGDGLCASDAGDVSSVAAYRVAKDQLHAGALALNSGMDQDLEFPGALSRVDEMLAQGLINQSTLDRAVGNVLRQKFAAGLFDNNATLLYVDPDKVAAALDAPAHRELARTVAEEGITLLKNDRNVLPLTGLGGKIKTVAVIGPNADNVHSHLGLYGTDTPAGGTRTVLNATIAAANASNNAFKVVYERGSCLGGTPGCPCATNGGCRSAVPEFSCGVVVGMDGWQNQTVGDYEMPCFVTDTSRVATAAAVAAAADVTLLVIGDQSTVGTDKAFQGQYYREVATVGEHFDRDNLDPVGAQLDLLKAVVAASPNVIVVLIHGRPMTFGAGPGDGYNKAYTDAAAVLAAWHPGEEGGAAVWNILSGEVNPSGRTAHTWPRTVGQVHQYVPYYLEQRTRPITNQYADFAPATPLVPFGWGLSYTNFTLGKVGLLNAAGSPCDERAKGCNVSLADGTFSVQVDVINTGKVDGKLVVQVYFSQQLASRVRFSQMLLEFAKVSVKAGATVTATIPVPLTNLEMWSKGDDKYVVESAVYDIMVGQWAYDPKMAHHQLTVA